MPAKFLSGDSDFDAFYSAYPKKKAPLDALKAWNQIAKIRPPLSDILKSVEDHKKTKQWQSSNGQYIPFPATFLRAGRFFDELEIIKVSSSSPWR